MDESRVVTEGSPIMITCEVEGFPQPSVSFKRHSKTILGNKRIKFIGPVSMPTYVGNITRVKLTLCITEVLREDYGKYECCASNSIEKLAVTKDVFLDVQCK